MDHSRSYWSEEQLRGRNCQRTNIFNELVIFFCWAYGNLAFNISGSAFILSFY